MAGIQPLSGIVGRRDVVAAGGLLGEPRGRQEVGDQPAGDRVEHDRRDHDVDAAPDVEEAGDRGPAPADDHGDADDEGDVEGRRQGDGGPDDGRGEGRQPVLPVDADVEQSEVEADRGGDPGEVVRDRLVDDGHEGHRPNAVGEGIAENRRSR